MAGTARRRFAFAERVAGAGGDERALPGRLRRAICLRAGIGRLDSPRIPARAGADDSIACGGGAGTRDSDQPPRRAEPGTAWAWEAPGADLRQCDRTYIEH